MAKPVLTMATGRRLEKAPRPGPARDKPQKELRAKRRPWRKMAACLVLRKKLGGFCSEDAEG